MRASLVHPGHNKACVRADGPDGAPGADQHPPHLLAKLALKALLAHLPPSLACRLVRKVGGTSAALELSGHKAGGVCGVCSLEPPPVYMQLCHSHTGRFHIHEAMLPE